MTDRTVVIGLDYGTDSVRALIVDAKDGSEIATAVHPYRRWKEGRYCDPAKNQFRQHPLDYIEGLEHTVRESLAKAPAGTAERVAGIAVDTTGSTPCAVDRAGTPLALLPGFEDNPNAMFILWKDHTSVAEADHINNAARTWGGEDVTKYVGGIYSSEWFWAKMLHVIREDGAVRGAAYSWVEHCDWMTALLTGVTDVHDMKRSRCAAGHKGMWHEAFDGLPPQEFFDALDPLLAGIRDRLYDESYTSDVSAGGLSAEWAGRLGLPEGATVAVGAFDAHMGAVGGGIRPYILSKVIGTSTCDILTAPTDEVGDTLVGGICGQVDGSVVPGMLGMEAGQSGFGDIYAWFKNVLLWPLGVVEAGITGEHIAKVADGIIPALSAAAAELPDDPGRIVSVDWMNGRRTPDADQNLKGAITGLNLGSDAPAIFRSLVEATAYGSRAIAERFESEGVPIKGVIALGGVAKKSPFVMQTLADVMNREIKVAASEQTCALGAAMFAATAAGLYDTVDDAMNAMEGGFESTYTPDSERAKAYDVLYAAYQRIGSFIESETH